MGYLFIAHRGHALYGGRILGHGRVWGFDMILQNKVSGSARYSSCSSRLTCSFDVILRIHPHMASSHMTLRNAQELRRHCARAMSYLEVSSISRQVGHECA